MPIDSMNHTLSFQAGFQTIIKQLQRIKHWYHATNPSHWVIAFIVLSMALLAASFLVKTSTHIILSQEKLLKNWEQSGFLIHQGEIDIKDGVFHISNPSKSTWMRIPLYLNLSYFYTYRVEVTLSGAASVVLAFGDKEFRTQTNDNSETETVTMQGEVLRIGDAMFEIRSNDSEGPSSFILHDVKITGKLELSYGYRMFRIWFIGLILLAFHPRLSESRYKWAAPLCLLVIAGCMRLSYNLFNNTLPFSDMANFETMALNLLHGSFAGFNPFFQSFYPPGLSYYVAAIYGVFGEGNMFALRMVNLVLALWSVWICHLIGREIHGDGLGLLFASAFVFSQEMVFWGAKLSTEHLFTCVSLIQLYCLIKAWKTKHWGWFLLSGIGIGYLFSIRTVLHLFLLSLLILFMFFFKADLKRKLFLGSVTIFAFLVIQSPWLVRNYQLYDAVVFSGTGGWFSFMHQNNMDVPIGGLGGRHVQDYYHEQASKRFDNDYQGAQWVRQEAIQWVKDNPVHYLKLCLGRVKIFFQTMGVSLTRVERYRLIYLEGMDFKTIDWNLMKFPSLSWLVLMMIPLAWIRFLRGLSFANLAGRVPWLLPHLFLYSNIILYLLTFSQPRYRDPYVPFLLMCALLALFPPDYKPAEKQPVSENQLNI